MWTAFFFLRLVQHDDDILNIAYPTLVEQENRDDVDDQLLNLAGLKRPIEQLRASVSARRVISQTALVAPPDANGQVTTAGHTAKFSGIGDVREVVLSLIAGGNVKAEADGTAELPQAREACFCRDEV